MMQRALFALLLALALPRPAFAAPEISLTMSEAEERFTGDALTATLEVRAEERARLTMPPVEIEGFGVRSISGPKYDKRAGVHRFVVELVALEPGARWVGPFAVEHHAAGVTTAQSVPAKMVEIRSLLEDAESLEPKPPSEPLAVFVPDSRVIFGIYAGLLALVVAVAAFFAARALHARRLAMRPPPPPRPAWEIALESLARLREEHERGLTEEAVEPWADAVSDVLRRYLGARYGFDGLESTSDELLRSLRAREPSDARLDAVRGFLRESDLVKFAKARLAEGELDDLLRTATRIVEETRPFSPVPQGDAS